MARALFDGDVDDAGLGPADRALVAYAEKLTRSPARMDDADVAMLREHGFDDAQIWEATFTASIFNLFTRMADAFGIAPPQHMLDALERD